MREGYSDIALQSYLVICRNYKSFIKKFKTSFKIEVIVRESNFKKQSELVGEEIKITSFQTIPKNLLSAEIVFPNDFFDGTTITYILTSCLRNYNLEAL